MKDYFNNVFSLLNVFKNLGTCKLNLEINDVVIFKYCTMDDACR